MTAEVVRVVREELAQLDRDNADEPPVGAIYAMREVDAAKQHELITFLTGYCTVAVLRRVPGTQLTGIRAAVKTVLEELSRGVGQT